MDNATGLFIIFNNDLTDIRSHIGMIIQSTTLDTEEKVISIYGGTSWKKIEGRLLIGADSTYGVGTTGGSATHTLTVNEMPSHNHGGATGAMSAHASHNHWVMYVDGRIKRVAHNMRWDTTASMTMQFRDENIPKNYLLATIDSSGKIGFYYSTDNAASWHPYWERTIPVCTLSGTTLYITT